MEKILPQPLSDAAYPAIVAVVYAFLRVVIPEFAYRAVVPSPADSAVPTVFRRRLGTSTQHTEHIPRGSPVQGVVFDLVVAEATSIPSMTICAL
jgi:hypothetical protein